MLLVNFSTLLQMSFLRDNVHGFRKHNVVCYLSFFKFFSIVIQKFDF